MQLREFHHAHAGCLHLKCQTGRHAGVAVAVPKDNVAAQRHLAHYKLHGAQSHNWNRHGGHGREHNEEHDEVRSIAAAHPAGSQWAGAIGHTTC